jgi:CPA2 family monovalent cation:H+ antiporter-2
MTTDPLVFRDLAFVFAAAVVGGGLAWWTRQPLILGYVLGGLLVSPFTPGPSVADVRNFDLFAQVGVVLLMFSVGIEFSLKDLVHVRWVAFLGGPIGIALCVALGVGVGALLGWSVLQGAVVGMIISVASTMVLTRLLLDRGELHSRHGRIMMGILLVEDLAVVVLIVLIPALGAREPGRLVTVAIALGKAALVLLPFILLVWKVVPPIMRLVARMRNDELLLLVALAIGLGTAALTQAVGLSLALGAFLAGLIIGESDYAHETLDRLLALRDAFGALFFVTIGALIDPRAIASNPPLLGIMVALIVAGKFLVRTSVVWLFGQPFRTAILVGVGLAQIGEFSFVMVEVARSAGHVSAEVYNATLAASLITLLLNALLVRAVPGWVGDRGGTREQPPTPTRRSGHVVVCGFDRVGSAVGEALETFGLPFVVVEQDPDIVKGLRARQLPCLYGDATRRRNLERAGVDQAALVVVALAQPGRVTLVIRRVRELNPAVPLLARAHHPSAMEWLMRAGATEVIQPELEAAATLIRHSLRRLALPTDRVLAYLERFRGAMEMGDTARGAGGDRLPRVADIVLGQGTLADQSLREARVRERLGVTVVAVTHAGGEIIMNPSAETILRAGDRVRIFGLPEQIEAFRAETDGRSPVTSSQSGEPAAPH